MLNDSNVKYAIKINGTITALTFGDRTLAEMHKLTMIQNNNAQINEVSVVVIDSQGRELIEG